MHRNSSRGTAAGGGRQELLAQFEEISRQMEIVFGQLRGESSEEARTELWETVWKLKKVRSRIAGLLRQSQPEPGQRRKNNSIPG